MKIYNNILMLVTAFLLLLTTQSCFQNMDDDPAFNYPEEVTPEPEPEPEPEPGENPEPDVNNPLKLFFAFEDNLTDQSEYKFQTTKMGNISYIDGINGKAYQGSTDKTYFLIENHPSISDRVKEQLTNLGEFTVAFWIRASVVEGASSIFSIPNTTQFWSNLDIFFDAQGGDLKVHLLNNRTGTNVEEWFNNSISVMDNVWHHLAVTYHSSTETIALYIDGELFADRIMSGYGEIVFADLGTTMVVGTLPFQTEPSLTSGGSAEPWGGYYNGQLDQLRFYSVGLSAEEIEDLYNSKN